MTPRALSRTTLLGGATLAALVTTAAAAVAAPTPPPAPATTLVGRAVLPADTFGASAGFAAEPSGSQITDPKRATPFADQPVQGFSAFAPVGDGTYWAMPDNGYGSDTNSVDFFERIYRVRPDFKTATTGSGGVTVLSGIQLTDPNSLFTTATTSKDLLRADRRFTGDDVDIESLQVAADGTLWIGDEFGPWLLHFSSTGVLLDAPFTQADVRNPGETLHAPHSANGAPARVPGSGGYEGLAVPPDGTKLYTMLEKATTDDPGRARISEFDLATKSFTGKVWYYRYHVDAGATGSPGAGAGYGFSNDEFQLVPTSDGHLDGVVLERDSVTGQTTTFRRVYELAFGAPGTEVASQEVADLEQISDPSAIGGSDDLSAGTFAMPFTTIEDLLVLSPTQILVGNDNNYPFDNGRTAVAGASTQQPDANEFIQLALAAPLGQLAPPATVPADLPESPLAVLLPLLGAAAAGTFAVRRRRRA